MEPPQHSYEETLPTFWPCGCGQPGPLPHSKIAQTQSSIQSIFARVQITGEEKIAEMQKVPLHNTQLLLRQSFHFRSKTHNEFEDLQQPDKAFTWTSKRHGCDTKSTQMMETHDLGRMRCLTGYSRLPDGVMPALQSLPQLHFSRCSNTKFTIPSIYSLLGSDLNSAGAWVSSLEFKYSCSLLQIQQLLQYRNIIDRSQLPISMELQRPALRANWEKNSLQGGGVLPRTKCLAAKSIKCTAIASAELEHPTSGSAMSTHPCGKALTHLWGTHTEEFCISFENHAPNSTTLPIC